MTDPRREASGEHDLSEEDRRLLEHMREAARHKDVVEPDEDKPEVGEAIQDDTAVGPDESRHRGESDAEGDR